MDKYKSYSVSALVMVLWAVVAVMTYRNNIHAFYYIEGFFAAYGFVRFGTDLARWLMSPTTKKSAPASGTSKSAHLKGNNYGQ